jgi:putative transposase
MSDDNEEDAIHAKKAPQARKDCREVATSRCYGVAVTDAVRDIGVTEVTYYRWRQDFGGLKSDQVNR